jgi:cytochrome c oxidase subunit III
MEKVLTPNVHERKLATDGVVGVIFLLTSEAMFFAGLISAYIVNRAAAMVWPPYGQPRLPIEVTAMNTIVLLASGFFLLAYRKKNKGVAVGSKLTHNIYLTLSVLLGLTFLLVQGSEWIQLLHFGLTTRSSLYGAFFYTLIGAHGLHVVAGLITLFYVYRTIRKAEGEALRSKMDSICLHKLTESEREK